LPSKLTHRNTETFQLGDLQIAKNPEDLSPVLACIPAVLSTKSLHGFSGPL
jgi:hypothetical protein